MEDRSFEDMLQLCRIDYYSIIHCDFKLIFLLILATKLDRQRYHRWKGEILRFSRHFKDKQ